MNALILLIPISLIFLVIAIGAFLWASRSRQFDDLDSSAHSILMDEIKSSGELSEQEKQKIHD